jgi:DNA topoisomerase-2
MNTEYRKLKNQARFVMEIIENKLVVSKKKKPVLVAELRKRDYEPFPKGKDAQKAGETDDVVDNDEEVADDEDSGARDYDYLLGVSDAFTTLAKTILTVCSSQSGLSPKSA